MSGPMIDLLGKKVGTGHPTFVIAEAGINHNGSLASALDMVKVARDCGADAVKFQKRTMSALYRPDVLADPGRESHGLGVYVPLLEQFELKEEDHEKLKTACDAAGIAYLCSPWDIPSVEFLERLGVGAYKVPSACFSDLFLADVLEQTRKPVIFSTGMHEAGELEVLLRRHREHFGTDRVAFLHCVSSYPTANKDVNLAYMDFLREYTGCVVGYSGHERGIPITVAAAARGAAIVERHFTLDRILQGPDHAASLEPHGLETLVRHIRAVDEALGCRKVMNRGEIMARETLGKVLTWASDMLAGTAITEASFMAMSPGHGISAHLANGFVGRILQRGVKAGQAVQISDIGEEKIDA